MQQGYPSHIHCVLVMWYAHLPRIEALKEAICAHQDLEVIRSLFEGGKVPDEVRADLWKVSNHERVD